MEESISLLWCIGIKESGRKDNKLYFNVGGRYEVVSMRAQDIPAFVESGSVDVGITGLDLMHESMRDLEVLLDLNHGKCKLVFAVPEDSDIRSVDDITDGLKVATSHPNLAAKFFKGLGKDVTIVPLSGAVELAPHMKISDAIVDLSETGATLKSHNMAEIHTILESHAVMIGRKGAKSSLPISELVAAVKSIIDAMAKRYLMANVPEDKLNDVKVLMPGISAPTIIPLMDKKGLVAVHAVVNEDEVNGIITMLKKLGATGILVVPIERMVE
jgi:ATP phosphoribosyltransferase